MQRFCGQTNKRTNKPIVSFAKAKLKILIKNVIKKFLKIIDIRYSVQVIRYSVLGSRFSVLGSRFSVYGSRYSVISIRYSILGIRYSVSSCCRVVVGSGPT